MKGQAAMEFILTYGWAIIVVLLMISALAYVGVLNPQNFLPSKCLFNAGLGCNDHVIFDDGSGIKVTLILTNNFGSPISVSDINITDLDNNAGCECSSGSCDILGLWKPADTKMMNLSCTEKC